jgi:hypothetical protein
MSALVTALDNYTPSQIGENGHVEYGWSNDIREKIVQFSFQLTRTNEERVKQLQTVLKELLSGLKYKINSSNIIEREVGKSLLSILYRLIGHTRDIIDGKGEYTLTYMMIYTWYEYYPELSKFALKCLVDLGDQKVHQYGSWKDMKYFCEYCKNSQNGDEEHPLISYAIELMNTQLRADFSAYNNTNATAKSSVNISLVAKWIPREKSTFSWLYESLALRYFSEYMKTANTIHRQHRAILKCKTEYRKVISVLNKYIDTLQIKQCGRVWSSIKFNNVTSISLSKQKKAFLNINKKGEIRYPDIEDRINCATNFNTHIQKALNGETEMKGKRLGMADFTKQALDSSISQAEKDLLNSQWRDNSSQTGALGNMIAMVDISNSMDGDPMNVAIALGIRIAEKSILGKRVMTFSSNPTWVNLEPYTDFVSQVNHIEGTEWGLNTNFEAALNMILDAIIENKMDPSDVEDMILVILSDMQMDKGDESHDKDTLYKKMDKKYQDAGIRVHGKPYKPPHILFWNLRSSNGFPTLSSQQNASMMSGFSPSLLNMFCEKGLEALQSCTPWSILDKMLDNERYKIMNDKLNQEITA